MDKWNKWTPQESIWAEAAYQEVIRAFPDKGKDRGLALCLHCFARKPAIKLSEIEFIAQSDLGIPTNGENDKKITENIVTQAKKLLHANASRQKSNKKAKAPTLSRTEKALLSKFQASALLFEQYTAAEAAIRAAKETFEQAREALRSISHLQAEVLADADPLAAQVMELEGILGRSSAQEQAHAAAKPTQQQGTSDELSPPDGKVDEDPITTGKAVVDNFFTSDRWPD